MAGEKDSGLSDEDIALIEGSGSDSSESDADRRKRIRRALIQAGVIEPTQSDLIDLYGETLDQQLEGPSAEDLFRQGLESGTGIGGFKTASERAAEEQAFNADKTDSLSLLTSLLARGGGGGREFRPSTMQQPSESDLFRSVSDAELGPAPDLLFRDVYKELFPAVGQGEGPFEKFAQKQAKDIESQFLTETFQKFNEPGFIDSLRGDYENLYRQKESGDFNGSGGTIPAFEDFIKDRVQGDYRSYLQTKTSMQDLRKAFELASPDERGQRDAGSIAPMRRIL